MMPSCISGGRSVSVVLEDSPLLMGFGACLGEDSSVMRDSTWELECTEMSSSGLCFGRDLDKGSSLKSGSFDVCLIEGGHLVAAGIKGTTSVSILTGRVGIVQVI